jgi:voltage-gated potassium channel
VQATNGIGRQLRISLCILIGLFGIGALGFWVFGDRSPFDALYLATVILTTVGLKEGGADLNDAEKAWSVLLMITGIGTALYATGNIVAFFIDGQIRSMFGRRQLMSRINQLRDHVIVIGFGRIGQAICQTLAYKGVPFVIIDNDDERLVMADTMGMLYLRGDAMHEEVLVQAGLDRARGLASCLKQDADNVFVTLTARGFNEKLHIITRAEQARSELKMIRAGASRVICPSRISASRMTHLLINPAVEEILELDGHWPDLEVTKLAMKRFPAAAGMTLEQLDLSRHGSAVVLAVVNSDGTRRIYPCPDTVLDANDEVVIAGDAGCVTQVVRTLEAA